MAEGGGNSDNVLSGSDCIYDFYCELCKEIGRNVEAEGFCVDCNEYLCGLCYNGHQRTRQTRHHELLGKNSMPKDTPLSSDRVSKDISTKCRVHAGEPLTYYCKVHDFLGCSVCFVTAHRKCADIESVVEKSENILDSQEYVDFMQILMSLDHKSRDLITKSRASIAQTNMCYSEVIKSIKQMRKETIEFLDELERNIIAEVETIVTNEELKMTSISEDCETAKLTLDSILEEFQSLHSSKRVCQVYISMKENNKHIKLLKDSLHSAEKKSFVNKFRFEPNRKFKHFIESPHALGKILSEAEEITRVTATPLVDICWVTDGPIISGSVVLSRNRMITLADRISLLDTQYNVVIHELELPYAPWDVAAMDDNRAAVTVTYNNEIYILRVSSTLSIERKIKVDGYCRGIAYSKDRLIVTYVTHPKVEIMDKYGNVIKRIKTDNDGNEMFIWPQYVCVSRDGDTMYISDEKRNDVISLTMDGVVKSVYGEYELKSPEKICVDHHDNVYVCGQISSLNVHRLTADLTKIQTIMTHWDGDHHDSLGLNYHWDNCHYCLSHCQETNRLYMGIWNRLRVFQLS